jgi:hypothetical protein
MTHAEKKQNLLIQNMSCINYLSADNKYCNLLDAVVYAYNPSVQKIEAGRLQVPRQPSLHSETLSTKMKPNHTKTKIL